MWTLFNCQVTRTYEASASCPDNSIRYTIAKKATFHKADGTIGGIVGVITDITELKKAEEALKESKARFEDLSEASFESCYFHRKWDYYRCKPEIL